MKFADLRCICIDDSPVQADKIASVVASFGVKVVAKVRDGAQGITLLKAEKPDVAFIDVIMPMIGGQDVLRAIIEAKLPTVPIMCSSMHLRSVEDPCKALGAKHFVIKPYDEIITAQLIEKILRAEFNITD